MNISGYVVDEPNDWDNDDFEDSDDDAEDDDAMDESLSEARANKREELMKKRHSEKHENRTRFSHFFKQITVEYDRDVSNNGEDNSMDWKKPMVQSGTSNLPNSADFDEINFKRVGDENVNVTIKLYKDTDKFKLSEQLLEVVLDDGLSRGEITQRINMYIGMCKLADETDPRRFHCDAELKAVCSQSLTNSMIFLLNQM